MGRRKIEIALIEKDRDRSITFTKRKQGLFKKAQELGVLCNADVAVIVFSQNDKLYEFCSRDMRDVLGKYAAHHGLPPPVPADPYGHARAIPMQYAHPTQAAIMGVHPPQPRAPVGKPLLTPKLKPAATAPVSKSTSRSQTPPAPLTAPAAVSMQAQHRRTGSHGSPQTVASHRAAAAALSLLGSAAAMAQQSTSTSPTPPIGATPPVPPPGVPVSAMRGMIYTDPATVPSQAQSHPSQPAYMQYPAMPYIPPQSEIRESIVPSPPTAIAAGGDAASSSSSTPNFLPPPTIHSQGQKRKLPLPAVSTIKIPTDQERRKSRSLNTPLSASKSSLGSMFPVAAPRQGHQVGTVEEEREGSRESGGSEGSEYVERDRKRVKASESDEDEDDENGEEDEDEDEDDDDDGDEGEEGDEDAEGEPEDTPPQTSHDKHHTHLMPPLRSDTRSMSVPNFPTPASAAAKAAVEGHSRRPSLRINTGGFGKEIPANTPEPKTGAPNRSPPPQQAQKQQPSVSQRPFLPPPPPTASHTSVPSGNSWSHSTQTPHLPGMGLAGLARPDSSGKGDGTGQDVSLPSPSEWFDGLPSAGLQAMIEQGAFPGDEGK
ncbi:hypothetical protein SAICODRAFT_71892 [Saitoella complicata NRRL Y-17804]|uniref:MADS-box domain-containing protein n=1 Tax=Saitoella complicata (strain BCRC 22490 / CBS 7301 / JCM 7358 / NBRC 10748 / NRRL Y-17804) TaxID=698492 RepID=A0A0E9NPG9_SAICN|nr:uncharacterized protein SAICODRAFT_71892 [Saitoella complicata NRRL Y-17804]ODQ52329.1 hypothetical protein SAICODRAFT_71892 [Saitoella complicata NRRL Y-17804]GAO51698.1 hypothetical protein G7K_5791-t1 [Saitoella complicata NRRL Y-17804]